MNLSCLSASFLLGNYPTLWRRLHEGRGEALLGGYKGVHKAEPFRGIHSDPTARRALKLMELDYFKQILDLTGVFIDELTEQEQRVLISMWRCRRLGWRWIARDAGMPVGEVVVIWNEMTLRLEKLRKVFAGGVPGEPGTACAGGLRSA